MITSRTAALLTGLIVVLLAPFASGADDDEPLDVKQSLAALAKRYAIKIEIEFEEKEILVETPFGAIHGERATSRELEAYVPILVREFGRYPEEFVGRMGLEKIVICRELVFIEQPRAAIPNFGTNTMFLDAHASMTTEQYARGVIHHEFFHIVDWRDDGKLYEDTAWAALNAEDFSYGDGGVNAQDDSSMSLLTDKYPGFLTKYSMSGVEEDKAEVFAHLFVNSDVVAKNSKTDKVLARKVEAMKQLLTRFTKKFDKRFWKALEKDLQREREEAEARKRRKQPAPLPHSPQSPEKISLGHMACTPTF